MDARSIQAPADRPGSRHKMLSGYAFGGSPGPVPPGCGPSVRSISEALMSWAFSRVMAIMLRLPEYHADGVGSRDRGLTCLLRWVFGPRAFLRKGGAGAFACQLLIRARGWQAEAPGPPPPLWRGTLARLLG